MFHRGAIGQRVHNPVGGHRACAGGDREARASVSGRGGHDRTQEGVAHIHTLRYQKA